MYLISIYIYIYILLQVKDVIAMVIALFVDSRFWFTKGSVFISGEFDVISGSRGMFLIFFIF